MYKQVKKRSTNHSLSDVFSAPFPREKAGEAQKLNSEKCVFYSERKKISTSLFLVLIPKVFPYKRRSLGHNLH